MGSVKLIYLYKVFYIYIKMLVYLKLDLNSWFNILNIKLEITPFSVSQKKRKIVLKKEYYL